MNTNDLNALESQMRSWTPRRPSPALNTALLAGRHREDVRKESRQRRLPGLGWLAPVACVFILALQLVVPDGDKPLVDAEVGTAVLAGLNVGNRALTAFAPGWANSAMNNVNGETFESTNWTTAPSPMRTLPVFLTLTNGLIQ